MAVSKTNKFVLIYTVFDKETRKALYAGYTSKVQVDQAVQAIIDKKGSRLENYTLDQLLINVQQAVPIEDAVQVRATLRSQLKV